MSETSEREPEPSSSENQPTEIEGKEEICPVPIKRRKMSDKSDIEKLEHRLGGILCCAVCLDLPRAAVYQCSNGHLMCAACFTHLLADARLRDETATCPNCRVEISKMSASRNLAVEKAISELPSECKHCAREFPRHALDNHEERVCEERVWRFKQILVSGGERSKWPSSIGMLSGLVRIVASLYHLVMPRQSSYILQQRSHLVATKRTYPRLSGCKYSCIGCPWKGPYHELNTHESNCAHPNKTGADVMEVLIAREKIRQEEKALYSHLFDLLSYEKITFNDLQLKPYRTDEFVNKLYYESSRFSAFNHQWVVKSHVNNDQRDPTQSFERNLTYQLILKSKSACPLVVNYLALRGPYGDTGMVPKVHGHTYAGSDDQNEAPPVPLPLLDAREANRLLSNKAVHFRLIMFLASK